MHNNVATRIKFSIERTLRRLRFKRAIGKVREYSEFASNLDQFIDYCVNYLQKTTEIYFVGIFVISTTQEYVEFRNGAGDMKAVHIMLERRFRLETHNNIQLIDFPSDIKAETAPLPLATKPRWAVIGTTRYMGPFFANIGSQLRIPIQFEEQIVGSLWLETFHHQPSFDQHDLPVLISLANQLGFIFNKHLNNTNNS
jgi:hypothetical protein